MVERPIFPPAQGIHAAVIDFHIAFTKAKRFGLRCTARMPAMTGEQSRQAAAFNSAQYWQGLATKEERDAAAEEIDRASAAYFNRGVVAYPQRTRKSKSSKLRRAVLERDGRDCWLCGERMPTHDMTVEHLVARTNGGTDDLDNLALAHRACNELLGSLSLEAKLELRAKLQKVEA